MAITKDKETSSLLLSLTKMAMLKRCGRRERGERGAVTNRKRLAPDRPIRGKERKKGGMC